MMGYIFSGAVIGVALYHFVLEKLFGVTCGGIEQHVIITVLASVIGLLLIS